MRLYLDTSAIVSLFVTEHRTADVTRLVAGSDNIVVSDLANGEFCAAISTAVRMKRLSAAEGIEALEDFDTWYDGMERIAMTGADMRLAISHVRNFDLALLFPDALHLAISARVEATLVTGDRRQADAAKAIGVTVTFL